ncbi:unnamed protein product, partial [Cladocopium goreaui]
VAKPKAKKEKSAVAEGLDLASSGKWQQTHQQLAEARGIPWPLQTPHELEKNPWFDTLSLRERENVLFLMNESATNRAMGRAPLVYGDLYHSANRTPSSGQQEVPTILPSTKLWHLERGRLLLGRELLHLQGIRFNAETMDKLSETQMTDLAGNAFSSTVCLSILIAICMELNYRTESESEQEGETSALLDHLAQNST